MEKDKVLSCLRNMGFRPNEVPEVGYSFVFEGLSILYTWDEGNEELINLSLPCIFEGEEENRPILLDLVNEMNLRLKYVKSVLRRNEVWVHFEVDCYEEESLEKLLQLGIYAQQAARFFFTRLSSGEEDMASIEEDGNDSENGKDSTQDNE